MGFKAAQLRAHYEPEQTQAQDQVQDQVPAQLIDQVQRPVAADVARAQAREQVRQALAAVLATATGGPSLTAGLAARNVSYRVNQNEAGQNVSMSFGEHQKVWALPLPGRYWRNRNDYFPNLKPAPVAACLPTAPHFLMLSALLSQVASSAKMVGMAATSTSLPFQPLLM